MKTRAPRPILYKKLDRWWLVSAPTPFFPQSGMGEITVCVPVLAPLLFYIAADKLLALVNNKWASLLFQPFIFCKVTYELWGSRVRLSRLGFGIFRMHFVKHIFLSLNSKFHLNPLSLSGTVIPQSSANLLSTKMS